MDLVYLLDQPLDKRNRLRLGVEYFLRVGDQVEVIDMTQMLFPDVHNEFLRRGGIYESDGITFHRPASLLELIVVLKTKRNRDAILIDLTGDALLMVLSKALLQLRGLRRLKLISGVLPAIKGKTLRLRMQEMFFAHGVFALSQLLLKACILIITKVIGMLFPCDIWVLSCAAAIHRIPPRSIKRALLIKAHALDYDLYLDSLSDDLPLGSGGRKYAVFLDEDMCFHTDFLYSKTKPPATPEKYFTALNSFFEAFKTNIGVDVVVAEHPRAHYTSAQKSDYFSGCEVYTNATAQLIKNASIVLCHSSTSVGLAVLYKKPIIFLTSNEIANSNAGRLVEVFSGIFGKKLINIDDESNLCDYAIEFSDSTVIAYSNYVDTFIKHPESLDDKSSWELVRRDLLASSAS